MLRRRDPPVADVSLAVPPVPFYPGDAVPAEITVTPRRDFTASRGLLRLESIELLRIDSARDAWPRAGSPLRRRPADRSPARSARSPDAGGPLRPPPTPPIDYIFAQDAPMPAGVPQHYAARLLLPRQAPPTVKGKYARITWQLTATVSAAGDGILSRLGGDTAGRAAQELVVFAGPDAAHIGGVPLPERPGAVREHRAVTLNLTLDAGRVPNGGIVSGALTAQPRAAFRAREVRVELVRWERSGSKQTGVTESRQVLQRPAVLAAGATAQWHFRLPVPAPLMPSVLAQHTFVGWQVRAIIARTLRLGISVTQPVQIYTSPQ